MLVLVLINKKNWKTLVDKVITNSETYDNMIQAEFENGTEDENNFQIQEIDFQNWIDEDDA